MIRLAHALAPRSGLEERYGLVRAVGVEPTLCHQNRILSPARLPIPPRPRGAAYERSSDAMLRAAPRWHLIC